MPRAEEAVSTVSTDGAAIYIPVAPNAPSRAFLEGAMLRIERDGGRVESWRIGPKAAASAAATGRILAIELSSRGGPARARRLGVTFGREVRR